MVFTAIGRHLKAHRPVEVSQGEVHVHVSGGYHPDTIYTSAGTPIRLVFRREESSACSEQVVFPSFGKSATLPQGEDVTVEIPPAEPGQYSFSCAMGMLHGRIVVTPLPLPAVGSVPRQQEGGEWP